VTVPVADGRAQRRERNRTAVVEALLDLYREGDLTPSSDAIAARAGVSPRSLFRYFEDVDSLVREAIERQQAHLAPTFAARVDPALPFDERLAQLVAHRLELYGEMGHVARVARAAAPRQPLVAAELARIRGVLRDEVATVFAAELDRRPPAERAGALALADVVVSWEAVDVLRAVHGLDGEALAATVRAGLRAVLA
jgi:AcrR family transcriptional regulator